MTVTYLPPWMEHAIPAKPVVSPASVVIPCDSPEHADRLARLLREMASGGKHMSAADWMLLTACARAEVRP